MCTAPITISRSGGLNTCRKARPRLVSAAIDWSRRRAVATASTTSGGTSPSTAAPSTTSASSAALQVAHEADPALGRPRLVQRREQRRGSLHRLDIDLDAAAAGEADIPGLLVRDAELEQLGRRARPCRPAPRGSPHPRCSRPTPSPASRRPRRRSACCRPAAARSPRSRPRSPPPPCGRPRASAASCSSRRSSVCTMPHLPSRDAATHSLSPSARRVPSRLSTAVSSRRLPRLWAGRKSSTWRIIAFAPVEMGA